MKRAESGRGLFLPFSSFLEGGRRGGIWINCHCWGKMERGTEKKVYLALFFCGAVNFFSPGAEKYSQLPSLPLFSL